MMRLEDSLLCVLGVLVLGVLLSGCAPRAADPGPVLAAVEAPDLSCPAGPAVPAAPKPPRTLDAIVKYAYRLDEALVRSEAARKECARRLERVREYLDGTSLGGSPGA